MFTLDFYSRDWPALTATFDGDSFDMAKEYCQKLMSTALGQAFYACSIHNEAEGATIYRLPSGECVVE